MKQQEDTLLFLITSDRVKPTTESWSNIKVLMPRTYVPLTLAKNKERNDVETTSELYVWKHQLCWCDGPRYTGLRARLHYRFRTKHPEHPRESGCAHPAMGLSPNPNAIHTCTVGRSLTPCSLVSDRKGQVKTWTFSKAIDLCKAAKLWCKLRSLNCFFCIMSWGRNLW